MMVQYRLVPSGETGRDLEQGANYRDGTSREETNWADEEGDVN